MPYDDKPGIETFTDPNDRKGYNTRKTGYDQDKVKVAEGMKTSAAAGVKKEEGAPTQNPGESLGAYAARRRAWREAHQDSPQQAAIKAAVK